MLYLGPPNWFSSRVYNDIASITSTDWPKSTATSIPSRSQIATAHWSPDGLLLATAAANPCDDPKLRIWALDSLLQDSTPACTDLDLPGSLVPSTAISLIAWPYLVQHAPSMVASDLLASVVPCDDTRRTTSLPNASPFDSLVSASHAGHLVIWDFRKPIGFLAPVHNLGAPMDLAIVPRRSSSPAVSGDHDLVMVTASNYLVVFDARNLSTPTIKSSIPFPVACSVTEPSGPTGPRILLGSKSGELHDLSLNLLAENNVMDSICASTQAQVGPCSSISIDPKIRYIASSGPDSIINFCSWENLEPSHTCSYDQDVPVRDLSFTHDGELLTIVSELDHVTSVSVQFGNTVCSTKLPSTSSIPGSLSGLQWNPTKHIAVGTYHTNRPHRGKIVLFH